jgi:glutaredoxin-related protein
MTFEEYLDDLESTPPSKFRESLLTAYAGACYTEEAQNFKNQPVDWDEVLSSAKNYVEFLRLRFGDESVDEEVETRAHEYVIDPAALKQLVTGHIRWFWKTTYGRGIAPH